MKLIKEIKYDNHIDYFYENNISKTIWDDGEIYWFKNNIALHLLYEDGAAHQNCKFCKYQYHNNFFDNNLYNKHFYLNDLHYSPADFAKETNHKICLICKYFCNQECFMEKI